MISSALRRIALSEEAVLKLLPHRKPFLFVGHAVENTIGKTISAVAKLTDNPMLSKELQILEGMGQTSALVILQMDQYKQKGIPIFAAMRNVRWENTKVEDYGDLLFSAKMMRGNRGNFGVIRAIAHTENKEICSGDLTFSFAVK